MSRRRAWHGGPESEATFEGWMYNPGHRVSILDEGFRQVGSGTPSGHYGGCEEPVAHAAGLGACHP